MKLNELIKKLQYIYNWAGDLEVIKEYKSSVNDVRVHGNKAVIK